MWRLNNLVLRVQWFLVQPSLSMLSIESDLVAWCAIRLSVFSVPTFLFTLVTVLPSLLFVVRTVGSLLRMARVVPMLPATGCAGLSVWMRLVSVWVSIDLRGALILMTLPLREHRTMSGRPQLPVMSDLRLVVYYRGKLRVQLHGAPLCIYTLNVLLTMSTLRWL